MKIISIILLVVVMISLDKTTAQNRDTNKYQFKPFNPPINYEVAGKRADKVLLQMTLEEKINIIGGYNLFFIQGFENHKIPQLYLSDATQGVHIRRQLSNSMGKSVAFPCPIALTATWDVQLAHNYAKSIGEECRAGDVAVLLGPGMNIYRVSQNGRNFEYFGEDPFLAARMIENYVAGVQSTGTIATLKHFCCNNNEYHRRTTNVIVDERTLHEIYLPAFKAGIDAGAMAVMTSYNLVNGEWAGQNQYIITELLRMQLGFKWLVMSDWWSTWDPVKTIKSGLDLEMPGVVSGSSVFKKIGDVFVKTNAIRLVKEGKISEDDINRMAKNILRTEIAMGLFDRPVKDEQYLKNFDEHERIALQTARESIVLLKNRDNILPINGKKKILLTGEFVEQLPHGGGSAEVEGYDIITILAALKNEFGGILEYIKDPTDEQLKTAEIVLLSIGTLDSEGSDRPFELTPDIERRVVETTSKNSNTVVIVNSGGGIKMTSWIDKAAAVLYAWYPGQNGNIALAEVLSGRTNPSGKLPITIEKKFEDSPGYGYIPEDEDIVSKSGDDMNMDFPINTIKYKEGVLVGYRWYDTKGIEPLFHFGYGLSYTTFSYGDLKISKKDFKKGEPVTIEFTITNTGTVEGAETAQLYVHDIKASVVRPVKELKGFKKVFLNSGERKIVKIVLNDKDFSFWDENKKDWHAEPGEFEILIGAASNDIKLKTTITLL